MTNANSLRHKRSAARGLISMPFPTSSSTFMHDRQESADSGSAKPVSRWSGENLTPNDGYSNLFTSGMFPGGQPTPSPTLSSFPSPPSTSPTKSPMKQPHLAPPSSYSPTTPARRRRSSIIHTTPSTASPRIVKSTGMDGGVERALDNVMRSLKLVAMGTPRGKYNYDSPRGGESRWSSSTDGSLQVDEGVGESGGFWNSKPRKSSETTRSRTTVKSSKSGKSRGRKSEETDRMDLDLDQAPEVPPVPLPMGVPSTPGRSRRMMNGLVKRLGLTPKKGRAATPSLPLPDHAMLSPPLPPPLPIPAERTIPKKSSLSTLRSALTKKGSTTTLRSIRSTSTAQHPFMTGLVPTLDCETPPVPLPPGLPRPPARDEVFDGCFPSTPGRGSNRPRTPKSSIGQPKLQKEPSPSYFLREMPRRAPETPKRESFNLDPETPGGVIKFETEEIADGSMEIDDMDMALATDGDETLDQTTIFTPPPPARPSIDAIVRPSFPSPFVPPSQSTPVLTAKAARKVDEVSVLKSKRLVDLLPEHEQRIDSPSSSVYGSNHSTIPHAGLRSKKSVDQFKKAKPLKEKNINFNTPVNSLGLPAPPSETRSVSRASRKDPLGLMKRLTKVSQPPRGEENVMPFRSDEWSTPLPTRSDKIFLGTKERYFEDQNAIGTFGRNKIERTSYRPDFSAPPLPPSETETHSIGVGEVDEYGIIEFPRAQPRFEEGGFGRRMHMREKSESEHSMTSVSMTTGEGVEEWELERYLGDADGEAGGMLV
ncbi:hypothetical protein CI109_101421 [Kwoniella shandongensis]|uniref:Uncharacterized protein n=1 Tax=Kwoniella shandongensis TaxID=1734106 RepID=A0A5M6BW84_9TREE|nr:uncharacterized protein CI109_005117 [Kwoniella shandongensis]KAA5526541.1 hypothetical protein CI109_005117 [Kwoniella shandongensis]